MAQWTCFTFTVVQFTAFATSTWLLHLRVVFFLTVSLDEGLTDRAIRKADVGGGSAGGGLGSEGNSASPLFSNRRSLAQRHFQKSRLRCSSRPPQERFRRNAQPYYRLPHLPTSAAGRRHGMISANACSFMPKTEAPG